MPRYNKTLSCKREIRSCSFVLVILFLLSAALFGFSFLPKLKNNTTTRVTLWVLSCALFLITLVAASFMACLCQPGDDEWEDSPKNGYDSMTEKSMSPVSTIAFREAKPISLRQFAVAPIPKRRPSQDTVKSVAAPALSCITEENLRIVDSTRCLSLSPTIERIAMYSADFYWVATAAPFPATSLANWHDLKSPYAPSDQEPYRTSDVIEPAAVEGERLWEFDRNWTTWNGKTAV